MEAPSDAVSTSEYVRFRRASSGLSLEVVASRAGVSEEWLARFEAGQTEDGPTYDLLLGLIAATEPPRPGWWDSGHEHDLHLPADAVRDRDKRAGYWAKIEEVRRANRSVSSR